MADVKTLTINNVTYNIKDETARTSLASVVHKTGDETIAGVKTFSNVIQTTAPAADSNDSSVPTTKWVRDNLTNDYASSDLDNLTSEGKNTAEWSSNFSGGIIDNPNNIKYTFNNGVFTLLKGSKVYVPNGPGVFTEVVTTVDQSITPSLALDCWLFVDLNGSITNAWYNDGSWIYSGSSFPTGTGHGVTWYDTVNNRIRSTFDDGANWSANFSFPICRLKTTHTGTWDSIGDIFDGIVWIGSHVALLPGLKISLPNGRNDDGTCNNENYTVSQIVLSDLYSRGSDWLYIQLSGSTLYVGGWWTERAYVNYNSKAPTTNDWMLLWDERRNQFFRSDNGQPYRPEKIAIIGRYRRNSNTQYMPRAWEIRRAYKPLDRFDLLQMLDLMYPVGSIYLEANNTGMCPLQSVMQGTKWELVSSGNALWTGNGSNATSTINAGLPNLSGFCGSNGSWTEADGTLFQVTSQGTESHGWDGKRTTRCRFTFNAHNQNNIYGNSSTVQPPAYVVNVWRRTQ